MPKSMTPLATFVELNVPLNAQCVAEDFNRRVPIGSPVLYWPWTVDGPGRLSCTRSLAWDVGGVPCVMVENYAGGIALTHVAVIEAETLPDRGEFILSVGDLRMGWDIERPNLFSADLGDELNQRLIGLRSALEARLALSNAGRVAGPTV